MQVPLWAHGTVNSAGVSGTVWNKHPSVLPAEGMREITSTVEDYS